ncbi:MAG: hypothetical protein JO118_14355 [Acetobacteraceae bacterium]|nr:hypothetical protein [Acetobacteraceae bacterium]
MSGQPEGASFAVAELRLIQAWAEFHDLRLAVEMDHSFGDEVYEEVLSLYRTGSTCCRCVLWRTPTEVVVQPILGRASRFPSVADALESLGAAETEEPLTDIVPGPFADAPETAARRPAPVAGEAA